MRIPYDQLLNRTQILFTDAGLNEEHAQSTAEAICSASLRGVDSHGIRLIPHYLRAIKAGRIDPAAFFSFEQNSLSTGVLDANHGMAHAAVAKAMDHAIDLAKVAGCGFVSVKNSNHCGAMAYYGLKAAYKNMIGLAFTNATAKLKTFNASTSFFGLNPICFCAPMDKEDPLCYDASPSIFANNKIKMLFEKGVSLPAGIAADQAGKETTDPKLARMLIPIGGELAGYKGYSLAIIVDVLCSLLSGMPGGRDVSTMYNEDGGKLSDKRYLGQFVGAINIQKFVDVKEFKIRLTQTASAVRKLSKDRAAGAHAMMPGDPEKRIQKINFKQGVLIPESLVEIFV